MFVFAIIIAVVAVALLGFGLYFWSQKPRTERVHSTDRWGHRTGEYEDVESSPNKVLGRWLSLSGVLGVLLAVMFTVFASFYSQEAGEAKVLRDWTGNLVGSSTQSGAHWKAPWVDTVDWDIRNQQAAFMGDGTTTHSGQPVTGAEITFTDRDGVTGNMDIAVIYSIKASEVEKLTLEYTGQDDFKLKVVENDIRSIPRDIASTYTTIRMYNERTQLGKDIEEALRDSWASKGIEIEDVQIQGIRYSKAVKQRFEEAQNAQTEVVKAEAELKKTEIDAQQKVVQAEAEAKANDLLAQSLTEPILRQRYLDTLSQLAKAGNLVITDGTGSQVLIQRGDK